MKYKQLGNKIILRIDKGEEIVQSLTSLCRNMNIKAGTITGIGATNKATIGIFKTETKQFISTEFVGDYEITALNGNITTMNNKVYLHIHLSIGDINHQLFGGHLTSAFVSATFEGIIDIINHPIQRVYDSETRLNLLEI
ncbi:MAG: PPC domain-containing DNA-binding protein [Thermoplasmatota archaeon]